MFHVCGYTGKTNRISHKRAKRVSWHTIKRCDFFRKFDRNTQVQKKHSKAWFIAPISWRPCKLPTWLKIWKWMITKLWSSINFIYASVSRHIALEDVDHNDMLYWYSEIWFLWFIIAKVARFEIICKYHVFISIEQARQKLQWRDCVTIFIDYLNGHPVFAFNFSCIPWFPLEAHFKLRAHFNQQNQICLLV